jgi:DNA polymerase-1
MQTRTVIVGSADAVADAPQSRPAINWDSWQQVLRVLRERGHDIGSTAEDVLAPLAASEPLVLLLKAYKAEKPVLNRMGPQGDARFAHPQTGRIHAKFRQIGTNSGRMSCADPNLQAVSKAPGVRAIYHPPPDRVFVEADFSQIQLRIIAQVTQGPELLAAYRSDKDMHIATAAMVLGISDELVTSADRQRSKAINYGFSFGMRNPETFQAHALKYNAVFGREEAIAFRRKFLRAYPSIARWLASIPAGAVTTASLFGRKRADVWRFTEKLASPIQMAEADLLKLTLGRLWAHRAEVPSAVPVCVVHDSVLVECDAAEAETVKTWLVQQMAEAGASMLPDVPVKVEAVIKHDWRVK